MKNLAALVLFLAAGPVFAGEACSVMQKDGRSVAVPCSQLETPLPCSTVTKDAQGRTTWEDRPCRPGEQKTMQQQEREEVMAQKKACGSDFGKLRVGMSLDRFEQCTDGLVYVTETVTKGRVVETYRSTFYFVHTSAGKIVGFTKRID